MSNHKTEPVTLDDLLNKRHKINPEVLHKLAARIRNTGSLKEIREKVDDELFNIYIYITLVEIWQTCGWGIIITYNGSEGNMLSYISQTLDFFQLKKVKEAFEKLTSLNLSNYMHDDFPDYYFVTAYPDYTTGTQKLFYEHITKLEELCSNYWYDAEDGLGYVIDYITARNYVDKSESSSLY